MLGPSIMNATNRILIAGGGPVGLTAALALVRQGIPVTVCEANLEPEKDQRAASFQPSTLDMLDAFDITRAILPLGLVAPDFKFWDRPTGELVATFDFSVLADDTHYPFVLQYEQYKYVGTLLGILASEPDFEIRYGAPVCDITQTEVAVEVGVATSEGTERLSGRFLIGADGSKSFVRKGLGIEFEGFTYRERFLKICTPFRFEDHQDVAYRNYFADPDETCNMFKVIGEEGVGLWRVIYPIPAEESDAEAQSADACQRRLERFFPRDVPYDIALREIYVVSQRVAATFHQGRVALAGDSAHVNHPVGGLGLNSGIHDALGLSDALGRIWRGEADIEALERYSRQRHTAAHRFVQAQTIHNKKMLEERDPAVRRRNLDELGRTAEDPERARRYLLNASLIDSVRAADAVA